MKITLFRAKWLKVAAFVLSVSVFFSNCISYARVIKVNCAENCPSFLDSVCQDINKRFKKQFKAHHSAIRSGMNSNIFVIEDTESNEKLCLKVFKGNANQLAPYLKNEHLIYYKIANIKYDSNFFKHITNPVLANINFPIAGYKSEKFFASLLKYNNMFTLGKIINRKITLEEKYIASIAYDIFSGIDNLHNARDGVKRMHHDMHPDNILFNDNGGRAECFIIDCDFVTTPGVRFKEYPGTMYNAPENIFYGRLYDCTSEIFTIGTYLWALAYGSCPFGGVDFLRVSQKEHRKALARLPQFLKTMRVDKNLSADFRDFLAKILEPNPRKRLSARGALGHKFMKSRQDIPAEFLRSKIKK